MQESQKQLLKANREEKVEARLQTDYQEKKIKKWKKQA